MAPILDIPGKEDFERTKKYLDLHNVDYNTKNINIITSKNSAKSKYLEVPSIGLIIPKERTLFNHNFYETQEKLHSENTKMLTPYEFKEFLKIAKKEDMNLYNEITQVKSPWRAEWLDADFKMKNNKMHIIYHTFDNNGKIIQKSEKLDKATLMNDKSPGISIDSWLEDSTSQGLPKKSTLSGELYYWAPIKDDNSVARFGAGSDGAGLGANGYPSNRDSGLGVRAARRG